MSYKVISTQRFEKELKRLIKKFPSLKNEFSEFILQIKQNPKKGSSLGHFCYKNRISITSKGKGKRGGARIITYVFVDGEIIYLLKIYDKNELDNISDSELKSLVGDL